MNSPTAWLTVSRANVEVGFAHHGNSLPGMYHVVACIWDGYTRIEVVDFKSNPRVRFERCERLDIERSESSSRIHSSRFLSPKIDVQY